MPHDCLSSDPHHLYVCIYTICVCFLLQETMNLRGSLSSLFPFSRTQFCTRVKFVARKNDPNASSATQPKNILPALTDQFKSLAIVFIKEIK